MRKFLKYTTITVIICLSFIIAAGNYFYELTITRYSSERKTAKKQELISEVFFTVIPNDKTAAEEDLARLIFEKSVKTNGYTITSYDGLELHAASYEHENPTDKWIIAVHGYKGVGTQMFTPVVNFYENGYNVLVPDCRGHGSSEGEYVGLGWYDRFDIIGWAEHIERINANAQIVLYGVSMGGATILMSTGERLPETVKAAVGDCSYTSAYDLYKAKAKEIFGFPVTPLVEAASAVCSIRAGYSLREVSVTEQVKKSKTPTIFIHGSKDLLVPPEMVYTLYEASSCDKEIAIFDGAGHGNSFVHSPEKYWSTVFEFLDKYISEQV